jgi:hypothetical protein
MSSQFIEVTTVNITQGGVSETGRKLISIAHVVTVNGRAWDAWFTFSTMDAATRQTLLSCSRDHART